MRLNRRRRLAGLRSRRLPAHGCSARQPLKPAASPVTALLGVCFQAATPVGYLMQSSGSIGGALVLTILVSFPAIVAEDRPAPDGCHWQSIPELKAHIAVPDGWHFESATDGEDLVYDVSPARPGPDSTLQTRFRLTVTRGLDPDSVVARAREFVESVRSSGQPTAPIERQTLSVMTLFASVVEVIEPATDVHESTVAVSALANARTGTLYRIRLDIPASELGFMAPLANAMFRTIRVDDEI